MTGVANRTGMWNGSGISSDARLVTCDMKDETKKTRRCNRLVYAAETSLTHARRLVRVKGGGWKGPETPLGSMAAPDV